LSLYKISLARGEENIASKHSSPLSDSVVQR
jgi:hypothetical protein